MARTQITGKQVKDESLTVDDLKDFAPEEASGLTLTVRAGRIRNDNTITDKADQSVSLTNNTTNYVEINTSGVASANTTGFTSGNIAVAEVVTSGGAITSITDKRAWVSAGGSSGVGGSGTANTLPIFTASTTLGDSNLDQNASTGVLELQKGLAPKVITLSDGANISTDASAGNRFKVTIAGDRTLDAPTNPTDGQICVWRIKASGANRTLTLATGTGGFKFGSDITQITATVQDKVDLIGASYDSTDNRWEVVAYVKGY